MSQCGEMLAGTQGDLLGGGFMFKKGIFFVAAETVPTLLSGASGEMPPRTSGEV